MLFTPLGWRVTGRTTKRDTRMADYTKYDVTAGGSTYRKQPKNRALLRLVQHLCLQGVSPASIRGAMPRIRQVVSGRQCIWYSLPGALNAEEFRRIAATTEDRSVGEFDPKRWFCKSGELVRWEGETLAFSNQWGKSFPEAVENLTARFEDRGIEVRAS